MQKLLIGLFIIFGIGTSTFAQEVVPIFEEVYISGEVIDVGTDDNGLSLYETLLPDGSIVSIDTFGEKVSVGSSLYLRYFPELDNYNFITVERSNTIFVMLAVFILGILILAGKKGARSLVGLIISIGLLLLVLVPLLLSGVDPLLATVLSGLGILAVSIFITHGFNYQSLVSFLGSFASILVALGLIYLINRYSSMTGLINDEIQFLSLEMEGTLDLVKIVSASIVVGVLGVLDDITITQVAVVRELSSSVAMPKLEIFQRALRVGKDHIASLVNTLVFAYVGATLPMIMFISLLEVPFYILLSQEFIFIEIMRSLVGAIALTLAVPVTTWLSTHVFLKYIKRDSCSIESACSHGHH